jgi:hypothetical protein
VGQAGLLFVTGSKARSSFLKKRSKRLLVLRQLKHTGHGLERGSGGGLKVFWFFSSEKNTLASCLPAAFKL